MPRACFQTLIRAAIVIARTACVVTHLQPDGSTKMRFSLGAQTKTSQDAAES